MSIENLSPTTQCFHEFSSDIVKHTYMFIPYAYLTSLITVP